jgi:PucR C-terminal helix-turn-helix domain
MILHRNTIQYRMAKAMELCGQHLDDPDAVFRVQMTLEVCRWMAPTVLRPPNPGPGPGRCVLKHVEVYRRFC